MPLKYPTSAGAGDFTPVPAGTHIAVCNIVADIGIQPGSQAYPKPRQQVYVRFELPNERAEFEKDGKKQVGPAVIGKTYTASMNEKATLRAHLESWRGRAFTDEEASEFDVAGILGKACVLSVTHTMKDGKTYANITGVGKAMKGSEKIIPEISPVYYGPDNTATYKQLTPYLQKKIDEQIRPEPPVKNPDAEPEHFEHGNQLDDGSFINDDDIPF